MFYLVYHLLLFLDFYIIHPTNYLEPIFLIPKGNNIQYFHLYLLIQDYVYIIHQVFILSQPISQLQFYHHYLFMDYNNLLNISTHQEHLYHSISNNLQLSFHYYFSNFYHVSTNLVELFLFILKTLLLSTHSYFINLVYVPIVQEELYHYMQDPQLQSIHSHLQYLDHDNIFNLELSFH